MRTGYPGHLSGQHWVNVHRGKCPLHICNAIPPPVSCMDFKYILDINPFIRYMICKYFLPFGRLPLHF